MGAAGDMLAAALLELQPDRGKALGMLNSMGVPGVEFAAVADSRGGVSGTRLSVSVNGEVEGDHGHGHGHHHHHHHEHHGIEDIRALVAALNISQKSKDSAMAVYELIAAAEGRVHGRPAGQVHFHEVGAMDAVADIAATCALVEAIGPCRIVASPVNTGSGTVECAHGTLPVPAPATALLLEGIPAYSDGTPFELCTPTGAALVKSLASHFGPLPMMATESIGCGLGSRDIPGRANMVRMFLGEDACGNAGRENVAELVCDIDDMTGEEIAFASERIHAAGALDVVSHPASMKKGRIGVSLCALCREENVAAVADAIFRFTTTLGVRERVCRRTTLPREIHERKLGDGSTVRVKTAHGNGFARSKAEYDDAAAIAAARGVSLREARDSLG